MASSKRITVRFFRTAVGAEPVQEWLRSLPREDRAIIGQDIKTVEFGWPIGMPICRHVTNGVWEVRSSLAHGRIARVLFCMSGPTMHLLHGFIKKTQKTPANDLETALRRKKNLETYSHDQST